MNKRLLLILPALTIARLALADPHLSLAKQSQVLEEGGALTRYSIKTERNEFHFLPPQDWRITVEDEAQKVFFTPRDGSVQFAFKILWAADGKPAKVDVSAARAQILERYLDAKITEEFTAHAGNESGPAFDLTYATAKKLSLSCRVAFIPFAGGTIEFELVARPEIFPQHFLTFGRLLNSFQIEPANKTPRTEPLAAVEILPAINPDAAK